jgi:hypothetical protein
MKNVSPCANRKNPEKEVTKILIHEYYDF